MKKALLIFSIILSSLFSVVSMAEESLFDTSDVFLSNEDEFLKVDEAFVFDFYQQGEKLSLSFNIKDGYYLYQHQFKFSPENATITPVQLPKGIEHNDEYFGIQEIFPNAIEVSVNIEAATENAFLTIRYQGCAKKGLCYPPTTKKIPLDKVTANSGSASSHDILNTLTVGNSNKS